MKKNNVLAPTEVFVPRYLQLQKILESHEKAHWLFSDADVRRDTEQWKNGDIKESEKAFIKNILRLFTQSDTDICGLYVNRLLPIFKSADARMMLLSFANREVTHMLAYKLLNDTLGYDSEAFMSEFLSFSEMKSKHEFFVEDTKLDTPSEIGGYLAKQVLMEGVSLFGSFAALLSYSKSGLCPGMVDVNRWSIADESLHVQGLSELFKILVEENPRIVTNKFKAQIYETATALVNLEDSFIDLCYKAGTNKEVSADELKQYIRYVCDYRMTQLGFKGQYDIKTNPIPWIDLVTSNTIANFFETTVTEYSKNNLSGTWVY